MSAYACIFRMRWDGMEWMNGWMDGFSSCHLGGYHLLDLGGCNPIEQSKMGFYEIGK